MNKVAIPTNPPQISELDKQKDLFWADQSFLTFDVVLQNIDKKFKEWKNNYDRIGENVVEAFENVSELTEKKAQITFHMMVADKIVEIIKARQLDQFNSVEESIIKGQSVDIEPLLTIPDETEEIDTDKLRLMIISYLANGKEFEGHSQLFNYLKGFKISNKNESTMKFLVGIAGKMKDKFMGYEKMLPITKLLHSAMENKEKNLEYSDTKFRNGQKYKREFVEAVVFVVGGGSYVEYQNLMQYAESCQKNIIYGSTSMISQNEFCEQLKKLSEF